MSGSQGPIVTDAAIKAGLLRAKIERSRAIHAAFAGVWRAPARLIAAMTSSPRKPKATCEA